MTDTQTNRHDLPWRVEVSKDETTIDSKHWNIARSLSNDDAEFIAQACNAFHSLVEALDELYTACHDTSKNRLAFALERAERTLRKANTKPEIRNV